MLRAAPAGARGHGEIEGRAVRRGLVERLRARLVECGELGLHLVEVPAGLGLLVRDDVAKLLLDDLQGAATIPEIANARLLQLVERPGIAQRGIRLVVEGLGGGAELVPADGLIGRHGAGGGESGRAMQRRSNGAARVVQGTV